jgi:hypothetical protein
MTLTFHKLLFSNRGGIPFGCAANAKIADISHGGATTIGAKNASGEDRGSEMDDGHATVHLSPERGTLN